MTTIVFASEAKQSRRLRGRSPWQSTRLLRSLRSLAKTTGGAAIVFTLDRATKLLALHYAPLLDQPAPTFGVRLFLNPTFAFGIPGGNTLALWVSTAVVIALIAYLVLQWRKASTSYQLRVTSYELRVTSYALILAGALGNLADRLTRGATVDWIVVGPWNVNVADISILLGVTLLLIKGKTKNAK